MLHRFTSPTLLAAILFTSAFLFPFTASASVQVTTGRFIAAFTGTRYMPIHGSSTMIGTVESVSLISTIMPVAGSFSTLRAVSDYAPGGSDTLKVTLWKNGVATSLTCTMTGAATTCSDITHSVSVVQGDKFTYEMVSSATAAHSAPGAAMNFTPTTANDTFLTTSASTLSTSVETYSLLSPRTTVQLAQTAGKQIIFPEAGTLDKLVASTTAPGAGATWDFTVKQNTASSTITCQVNGNSPNWCADNVHSIGIAASDSITIANMPNGSPAATSGGFGVRFIPTVPGNFDLIGVTDGSDSGASTLYHPINGAVASAAVEASSTQIVNAMTIKGMSVKIDTAPTGVKTRVFTLDVNNTPTAATCTITGAASTCTWASSSTTPAISVNDGDMLDTSDAPTGTPGNANAAISLIANTSAPVSPTVTTTIPVATSITVTTATLNGNITAINGFSPTVRGFAWGTNSALSGGDTATTTDTVGQPFTTGAFTNTSLTFVCNTTYYARAYATNAMGGGLGSIQTFTTSACPVSAPTVTTQAASPVAPTTATLNGTVTALNGANVTVSGFAWGTVSTLSGGDTATTSASGAFSSTPSPFTTNLTGLTCGTTYYSRAYATNSTGDGLGSIVSFTPSCVTSPTLTTGTASFITTDSAALGGNITSSTASTTERGIVYGTTAAYTATSSESGSSSAGFTTGAYTESVFYSFNCNTTYHFAAYAINSAGTTYGSDANFTTAACIAGVKPLFTPSRISGVAPLGVFFDTASSTIATTDTSFTNNPFRDLTYSWNFGDPVSGVAGTCGTPVVAGEGYWRCGVNPGGNSKNLAYGPEAAHVFETPGTYTVTMTVKDGTNTVATTTTITVTDPNSVYSGTNTYCFANALPVAGVGGCPSGAQPIATTTFDTTLAMYAGTNKRLLFNRGDTFTSATPGTITNPGPMTIDAYGTGALPLITSSNINNSGVIAPGTGASDLRAMDLDITGGGAADTGTGVSVTGGSLSNLTFLRLSMGDSVSTSIRSGISIASGKNITGSVIQDNDFSYIGGASGAGYAYFGWSSNSAMLGNSFGPMTANAQHVVRLEPGQRVVISNNTLTTPAPGGHLVLTIRADAHTVPCPVYNDSVNCGSTYPAGTALANTQYIYVSDNKLIGGTTSGQMFQIQPASLTQNNWISDVIAERNWIIFGPNTQQGLISEATRLTVRNNLCDASASTVGRTCYSNDHANTAGVPTPDGDTFYNNTCYAGSNTGSLYCIILGLTGNGILIKNTTLENNLAYAPTASSPKMLLKYSGVSGTIGASGTYGNSSDAQVAGIDPLFASTTPSYSLYTDFMLKAGSYALGAGTSILGVLYDFANTLRQAVTSMGAFDLNPPTLTTGSASAVTTTTVTLAGNITITGGVNSTARGIVYGTTAAYTATSSETASFSTGAYTEPVTGLSCNTLYHYAAYATNSIGTSYGSDANFTTSACAATPPTVTTQAASSLAQTTATLNGNITNTGTASVTVRGFAYGTGATLATVIATTTDSVGQPFGTGAYTGAVSGLTCNTTYYARAYATNSAGDSLGSIQSFTTSACSVAAVSPPSSMGGGCSPGFVWNLGKMACVQTVATVTTTTPAPYPSGLSETQVQAILGLLNSFGVDQATLTTVTTILTGSPNSSSMSAGTASGTFTFTRDLQLHAIGADVLALQQYLNTHGYPIASSGPGSPGHETTYFGMLTKAALIKFQKAKGITPAAGYFGPLTRKVIESLLQ